jgi:DNA-binding CsgD family transcriptional regulator
LPAAERVLLGRGAECGLLDQLLVDGRGGASSATLLRGEPGIGKSSLLEYARERAEGWRTLRAAGVESEMELPFAGLHQLCSSVIDGRDGLPPPQRDALAVAFGMAKGSAPEPFLIALAVLTLLSNAAEDTPLLCLVDDVQWLDRSSVQVLAFVARRLQAESVVMLFAERESPSPDQLAKLSEIHVGALRHADARALLMTAVAGPIDELVRERILLEARGNPLALLELPRSFAPADLAGGFGLAAAAPSGRVEDTYLRRVESLPPSTQQLLLAAAAEPTGEPALLWRAAGILGLPVDAVVAAEADGLISVSSTVAFRHSLLRSAVYNAAAPAERRSVHRALSQATDEHVDPDRKAWHQAHATLGADEAVATELEESAARARARGGLAASAAFLEYAVMLTADRDLRARRALKAAEAKHLAGAPEAALALLAIASARPVDDLHSALVTRLRGSIALDRRRGSDAVGLLLDAVGRLSDLDYRLARITYMEAMRAASIAGRLGEGMERAAAAARAAPAGPRDQVRRGVDLLLDGLALRYTAGYAASAPALKDALIVIRDEDGVRGGHGENIRWPWSARRVGPDLFDDELWSTLGSRNVTIARDAGALSVLPLALNALSTARLFEGHVDVAVLLLEEADAISEATNTAPIFFGRLCLAGWLGDAASLARLITTCEQAVQERGEGVILTFAEWALAVLHNGAGRYSQALEPAASAVAHDELMVSAHALPELVEAAVHCGSLDVAAAAVERLAEITRAADTNLGHGLEARSRALISHGQDAVELYERSLAHLGKARHATAEARAHLLFGEFLRREGERVAAREHLRTAHETLARIGARGFAERARRELLATGETVRKRDAEASGLTPQESQVAQLAASGCTNVEIGAELFISPRTVEWHLRKVFSKLGISSRRQLRPAVSQLGVGFPTGDPQGYGEVRPRHP